MAAGYVEVLSLPFAAAEDLDRLGLAGDDPRRNLVRIANPLADTSPFLRSTLLPGLFAAVTRNTEPQQRRSRPVRDRVGVLRPAAGRAGPAPGVTQRPTDDELAAMDRGLPASRGIWPPY